MTLPRELRAVAGGLGVIVGALGCAAVVGAILVALGLPPASRADEPPPVVQPRPTELVVALTLSDPTLQAGVVRDGEVILARGLEVDIARELGRRLLIPKVRFVYLRPAQRLVASETPPWHLVLGVDSALAGRVVVHRPQRAVRRGRSGRRSPSRPSPGDATCGSARQDRVCSAGERGCAWDCAVGDPGETRDPGANECAPPPARADRRL